ncbi:MAG: ribulokinase [Acidimicrobiales bacterium]
MSEVFLGLDFGTESVRAVLVDAGGRLEATSVERYPHGQITPGSQPARDAFVAPLPPAFALQDPDDWLIAAAAAVRSATATAADATVAGIGLDFTSCTMLPARRDGTPLVDSGLLRRSDRPHLWPKLWKHHGASAQAERLTAAAVERREPWLDRYGGTIGLEWFFPKILEVINEDPEVADAAEVWLEAGDWVVWQLTGAVSLCGEVEADELVRSTCQAGYKALWSRRDGFPSADFLTATDPGLGDVLAKKLPGRFLAPGQAAGLLSPAAADLLGLAPGVPVSTAVIDAHAGVPGVGVSGPGSLVLVLGTSGCHMVMATAEHRIPGVAGVVEDGILPGSFGYETGQTAVGDLFDWVRRLCGETDHVDLEARARAVTPGAEGLLVLDWFNGCRTPLMDGGLTGAVLGAGLHHGPAHLYRAALEASAFGLRRVVETLRDGGVEIDRLVATGGLPTSNPLFAEITTSVLGEPVFVSQAPHGSALGAAILGALAADRFSSAAEAVDSMAGAESAVARPVALTPDATAARAYDTRYRHYRAMADLLASAPRPPGREP